MADAQHCHRANSEDGAGVVLGGCGGVVCYGVVVVW